MTFDAKTAAPTAPGTSAKAPVAQKKNPTQKQNKNKNKKNKEKQNKNNAKTVIVRPTQTRTTAAPSRAVKKVTSTALSVVRNAFNPPVPMRTITSPGRHVFDLRDRVQRRNLSIKVARLFKNSPAARSYVSQILSGAYVAGSSDKHGIALFSAEREVTHSISSGNNDEAAAEELYPSHVAEAHRQAKVHERGMIARIEDGMVKDELESNALGHLYLDSLLQPCSAPNPGIPDEENRGLSMKLRVRTVYLLPMTNNEAYVIVSRNPARHIQIEQAGGSEGYAGPQLELNTLANLSTNVPWFDQGGKELIKTRTFVNPGATVSIPVSQGYDRKFVDDEFTDADGDTLDLTSLGYNDGTQFKVGKALPCAAGDTFSVKAWTSDVTANNYKIFATFLVRVGSADATLSTVESGLLTGNGNVHTFSINTSVAAPANAIGVLSYGIINQGAAGTTTVFPKLVGALTLATSPVVYPIGASDLSDIQLLVDQASDVRVVGCRATLTYVAKKLEGGYVVGGQLPQSGDDTLPEGSLSTLAVIPGMIPRPLNGITPGISFPIFPLNATENDYHPIQELYDDDSFSEGAIQVVTTGADADLLILQTEMSMQARTERQVLMATTGEVDARAVSEVQTFIARKGPLAFVTGNDEHEQAAKAAVRDYAREHPTYSFFNGWFSGNTTTVSDVIV